MKVCKDEIFGPVMAIVPVQNDAEAISLMNDSPYGLTASLWTKDLAVVEQLSEQLEFGTVFMNRCDYLDPSLPWIGVKDSGKGHALSEFGFDAFVRYKSKHFRL